MKAIALYDVHRAYKKGPYVLRGFSMRVRPGSCIAILGLPRSGKSSILRLIAGIDRPQKGQVLKGLETSWVIPSYSFFSHYGTGAANIRFIARFYGLDESSYLHAVIEMSGMQDMINQKLDKLPMASKGQLAMSMALCLETDVYLFDDTIGFGIPAFRQKCADSIHALAARGKTVVIATSTPGIVTPFCTEAYCIDAGRAVHHANLNDGIAHLANLGEKQKAAS